MEKFGWLWNLGTSQTVLGRTQAISAHASGLVTVPFLGAGLPTYVRDRKTKGKNSFQNTY